MGGDSGADIYRHTLFNCTLQVLCFLRIEGLWRLNARASLSAPYFSNSICSLHVSVSHFGNSRNISNFFIIIIFAVVIYDQWVIFNGTAMTQWRLRWWLAFSAIKYFFLFYKWRTFNSNLLCFFNRFIYFIYLFLAALGLRCCVRASSSCCERGLLLVVVWGLLIAVASLVAEHRL